MLDAAPLLQPISPDQVAGLDLRVAQMNDNPLDKVKKERFQEDPLTLPAGTEPRKVNWQAVLEGSRALLQKHAKDLEACAYLCEALTRLHGLAGLERGLEITGGMLDAFWPKLHPGAPSAHDPEVNPALRAKWLTWIGSSMDLQNALRTVPIGVVAEGGRQLNFGDLLDARRLRRAYQENPTEYGRLVEAGLCTPDAWQAAVAASSAGSREPVASAAERCRQRLQQLVAVCESRFGADEAPSLGKLGELLELLEQEMRTPGAGDAAVGPGDDGAAGDGSAASSGPRSSAGGSVGPIQSREDVVRTLQGVIRFLRQTEPHSPVSYMLERCARWLGMSFDELMQDLVKDQGIVENLREKLGIQPPPQG